MSSENQKMKAKGKPKRLDYLVLFIAIIIILLIAVAMVAVPKIIPTRLYFVAVQSITIQDHWNGLSPVSPRADYQLNFQNGTLIGTGTFTADLQNYLTVDITIPREITQEFLNKLKAIEMLEGDYIPFRDHTDDYPSIGITIQTRRETIEIFTRSQGEENIPWSINMRNREFIIDNGTPAQALAIIEPYLRRDILEQLIDKQLYRSR